MNYLNPIAFIKLDLIDISITGTPNTRSLSCFARMSTKMLEKYHLPSNVISNVENVAFYM
jgi:hypothetical protein